MMLGTTNIEKISKGTYGRRFYDQSFPNSVQNRRLHSLIFRNSTQIRQCVFISAALY